MFMTNMDWINNRKLIVSITSRFTRTIKQGQYVWSDIAWKILKRDKPLTQIVQRLYRLDITKGDNEKREQ